MQQQGEIITDLYVSELQDAFRQCLQEIKNDITGQSYTAVKYLLAKVLYPRLTLPASFLDSIVLPVTFPSFNSLLDCVAQRGASTINLQLIEKLAIVLDELVLKPDHFAAVLETLLRYPCHDHITTEFTTALIKKAIERSKPYKNSKVPLVINKIILNLLRVNVIDRAINFDKIAKLCSGLCDASETYETLIAQFTKEEIQWLFYRLLVFEDPQNFLRGNLFATKLSRYVFLEHKKHVGGLMYPQLDKILLVVLDCKGERDLEKNACYAKAIAVAMQEVLDCVVGMEAHQFPEVAAICALIQRHVMLTLKIPQDRHADYISGYLVLRFFNTLIVEYNVELAERLKDAKFHGFNVTPLLFETCEQRLKYMSKLLQALATKSEKMTGDGEIPAFKALRSQENVTKVAAWLLKIASAARFIIFKETAYDQMYMHAPRESDPLAVEAFQGCSAQSLDEVSEETCLALKPQAHACAISMMLGNWFNVCEQQYRLFFPKPSPTFHMPVISAVPTALSYLQGNNPIKRIEHMMNKIRSNRATLNSELIKHCKSIDNLPVYSKAQIDQKISDISGSIKEVESELQNKEAPLTHEDIKSRQSYLTSLNSDLEFHQKLFKFQRLSKLLTNLEQLKRQYCIYHHHQKETTTKPLFSFKPV